MWFLEHEILFGGKGVWLRPGSQQLFGRTKSTDGDGSAGKNVFIDNKNVSRKHMMIKVMDVPPADGTKVHKRSQIEITDFSCRQGTVVDGDRTLKSCKQPDGSIAEDTTTLNGTEHTIRLSSSYPPFTIKWQDIIFTYASKEKKGASQSQGSTRNAELHAMDIKTSTEFLYGKTTHVVSQKRNLPKVLQALVSGTPVVTVDYIDAVLSAAAQITDPEGNYIPSQLEEDFETWWPQEKEYIPPAGQEPIPRPDQMLAPDPARSEVFSGLTFIFLNEAQHTSLHQVVAGGGGKALLFDIRLGESTVEEYVGYVRSVVGQKRRGRASKDGLPVVTIRLPTYPEELEDWATTFVTGVDRSLNQRSILQNEFLDAIIANDASSLRQPPTDTEISPSVPETTPTQQSLREPIPSSQSRAQSQDLEPSSLPADGPVRTNPRKRPARRAVTSRFTGFDDYEPPPKMQKTEHTQVQDTPMEDVQRPKQQSVPEYEPAMQSQIPLADQTQRTSRSQPQNTVDASSKIDQMFPASARFRKKREATQAPAAAASVQPETLTEPAPDKTQMRLERLKVMQEQRDEKMKQHINVKEETRKRMAEEEERRRAEEEQTRADLEGVDISTLHIDIEILDMKIRPREDRTFVRTQLHGEGWHPEWDGRKNFKKFRRRGTDKDARTQSQKVIVTLKPAPPRKGFGDSMVMDEVAPVRTAEDEKLLRRRLGGRLPENDDERPIGFQRRRRAKPTEAVDVEDSGPDEEESPRASGSMIRKSGRTQRVVETQFEDTQIQRQSKKRAGGTLTVAAGQPSAKKSRIGNEDSDEEEGGFRFRKRAKG
ncbi:uncharacterized protein N0V89_002739 [Didymosphaeria variabile]|uniref:FHA domain-containing protein n=1 Tax=Didymosphaeria variabile TaxID=1932322 RepID=A0A9W9CEP4_9PLEO|nr:uncharacterized protein N0V89_002739 [Didymosphaeria variabile]KAJ4358160.1 hypothetical protein N0V89_002739 [Didymosphaeria variabile]